MREDKAIPSMKVYIELILRHHGLPATCIRVRHGVIHYSCISEQHLVRIPKWPLPHGHGFYMEQWAMEQAGEQGVPVAKVLTVDDSRTLVPVDYMLETCLPGQSEMRPMPEMLMALGGALACIHRVPTIGYGRMLAAGAGFHESWADVIAEFRQLSKHVLSAGVVRDDLRSALNMLGHELALLSPRPCMNHGDFSFGNMLFTDGILVGIVDFSPTSNSPYGDLGDLACRMSEGAFDFVRKGYGTHVSRRKSLLFGAQRLVSKLYITLGIRPLPRRKLSELARGLSIVLRELYVK